MLAFSEIRQNNEFVARADIIMQRFYETICNRHQDVIDGGANYGRHLFPLAAAVPQGRVLAFEPLPDLCEILEARIKQAGLDNRVILRRAAISNHVGVADFVYFNESDPRFTHENVNAALSSLRPTDYALKIKKHISIQVNLTTMDIAVDELGLDVQFIKLDLEGAEFHALQGAEKMLTRKHPIVIFEDGGPAVTAGFGYRDIELLQFMKGLGYELFYLTGHPVGEEEWLQRDYDANWRPNNLVAIPEGSLAALDHLRSAVNGVAADCSLPLAW